MKTRNRGLPKNLQTLQKANIDNSPENRKAETTITIELHDGSSGRVEG
jgi:hypothetical protein